MFDAALLCLILFVWLRERSERSESEARLENLVKTLAAGIERHLNMPPILEPEPERLEMWVIDDDLECMIEASRSPLTTGPDSD